MEELIGEIVRSRRRTIALIITKDGALEVRAPLKAPMKSIKEFVAANKKWIEKKINAKKNLINSHYPLPKKFMNGEGVLYEGDIYKLQISDRENIVISDRLHFPKKFLPQAKQYLVIWLKQRALKKIVERVDYFASTTQLQYKDVKITSAEGIWGSCNSKGALVINWRLIMAPSDVLDYIVVHEMAHLVVKNHSKLFWNKVEEILPGYKKQEEWVKKNGEILML